ncbi:unnamed protein product [Cuscuta epithymum]|uniref:Uncharacterized protein n=1 Tax=Cuscuta epithymum TaxID=186058 RepID=A0AAV0DUI1_9ASTE|nr:unnamed protein product [Cuscuta epithymum]CAH9142549.1 unnamed protein product [Cuscuta epithymum]
MSFLAGRLAATEGAYFLNESKQAVARLARKKPPSSSPTTANSVARSEDSEAADVLPEVLRHSLPPKIFQSPQSSTSSDAPLTAATKWVVRSDPNSTSFVSPDAMNPLKAYVSIPQVTFGPKRWQLPSSENPLLASTANELRSDRQTTVNPEKLRAAAAGLSQIGKAFAAATTFVFGGAALAFGLAASKMELHNADDIRTKGKDIIHPRFEALKERLSPLRTWAGDVSKKWHWEREVGVNKEKTMMVKELSKILGAKPSS